MHIHYIQHAPFEGLGFIEEWLDYKGHTVSCTQVWERQDFPSPDSIDGLILMGGPMSVNDEELLPWLKPEKKFIYDCIKSNKKILGICFGAQLIADCLGASISKNAFTEIGWFNVTIEPSLGRWMNALVPSKLKVFHWHGETFDLPENAILHASSDGCRNQLFTYGENIAALQFHPEMTTKDIATMFEFGEDELVEGRYIQQINEITQIQGNYEASHAFLSGILQKLF